MANPVYLTINEFPGTGAPAPTVVDFNFAGGYISPAHVKAELFDPTTYLRTPIEVTDAHFVTAYRLSLPISVPTGQVLRVYRDTPKGQPLVNFTNGARIADNNLDLVAEQAVFVAAESVDQLATLQVADVLAAVGASASNAALSQAGAAAAAASAALSEAAAQDGARIAGGFALAASNSAGQAQAAAVAAADAVRADLADPAKGAALVGFRQSGTGAVATTVQSKMLETVSVKDFGAVGDGVTDDTAAILSAAVNSGKKFLTIPYGVKYDRSALLAEASFPDDVVLFDLSGINDSTAAGQSTKHFGIVSKDSAPDDTHWSIDSGHHAIVALNNYGTAGTISANERKGTIIWNSGQFALGPTDKRGFRPNALLQFTKESSSDAWVYQLRSAAPWVAIAGKYEDWAAGQSISGAGVYRRNGQHYVSTGAGTTGATAPTHTSGTVSDGGVSWTWVDNTDRSVFNIREDGRWLLGSGSFTATWRHKVTAVDASGSYTFEGESTGVSKPATLKLIPTGANGAASAQPYLRADDGAGLRVYRSDATNDICRFDDDKGLVTKEFASVVTNAADGDTTPTVEGVGTLRLLNTAATSITTLDDGDDGQIVHLLFTTANTTLVSSSTFLLNGSVNVTPSAYSMITMYRVPSSISARWVELSRSIK